MASVLAIISKSIFEKMSKKPKLGDVLDTDRYVTTQARLEVLAKGGSLFLVTVRPPDESLWLVAVLEKPKHKKADGAWVSEKNAAPMTDLKAVKDKLKFDNGAGIQAKPGALGMSLQTPRILTDADEALLRGVLPGAGKKGGEASAAKPAASKPGLPPFVAKAALPNTLRESCALAHWRGLAPERHDRLARAIEAAAKGAVRYVRSYGFGGVTVPVFVHRATGAVLHLVPGGTTELGLTQRDANVLLPQLEGRADGPLARAFVQSPALKPARAASVGALLMAAAPLTRAQLGALFTGETPSDDGARALRGRRADAHREALAAEAPGRVALARVAVLEAALASSGLRLPSEAEWEFAARSAGEIPFPFGAQIPDGAAKVRLGAHPLGLVGMGAAPELCADGWAATLQGAPADGSARAAAPGGLRALRGGAVKDSGDAWAGDGAWRWALCAARRPSTDAPEGFALRPVFTVPA